MKLWGTAGENKKTFQVIFGMCFLVFVGWVAGKFSISNMQEPNISTKSPNTMNQNETGIKSIDLKNIPDGEYKVGSDIPAGEYLIISTDANGALYNISTIEKGEKKLKNAGIAKQQEYCAVTDGDYLKIFGGYAKLLSTPDKKSSQSNVSTNDKTATKVQYSEGTEKALARGWASIASVDEVYYKDKYAIFQNKDIGISINAFSRKSKDADSDGYLYYTLDFSISNESGHTYNWSSQAFYLKFDSNLIVPSIESGGNVVSGSKRSERLVFRIHKDILEQENSPLLIYATGESPAQIQFKLDT